MTTNRATSPTATANPGTKRAGSKARTRQAKTAAEPTQLRLLDGGRTSRKAWQLDARTRRIGSERVAEAREILRRAQPPAAGYGHHKIAG